MLAILLRLQFWNLHWNRNVIILMKFSSLAALEVVQMTTSSAANDENFHRNDNNSVSVYMTFNMV